LASQTDAVGLGCFFPGHHGSDSLLPEGADHALPERWQSLAASLEHHARDLPLDRPVAAAWRDAVALAAALPAAPILTLAPAGSAPAIAEALADWQVARLTTAPRDALWARERRLLRELCAAAGTAKLAWAGLDLAVLHLVVPGAVVPAVADGAGKDVELDWVRAPAEDPWDKARAFWYRL
jgi:hypothetical protein